MDSHRDVDYRLELARGFLNEAEQDCSLKRWRSCVSGSILVLENSGLAVLMLFGVSALTHKPARHLSQLIAEGTVTKEVAELIEEILPELETYDSYHKMLVKYGNESSYQLPWELFNEAEALLALEAARKSMRVSSALAELVLAAG